MDKVRSKWREKWEKEERNERKKSSEGQERERERNGGQLWKRVMMHEANEGHSKRNGSLCPIEDSLPCGNNALSSGFWALFTHYLTLLNSPTLSLSLARPLSTLDNQVIK